MESVPEVTDDILDLINEIMNVPEGYVCFLCQITDETECVWDEIGPTMRTLGNQAYKHKTDDGGSYAEGHSSARYACYRHYALFVSTWACGRGVRMRLPKCVE